MMMAVRGFEPVERCKHLFEQGQLKLPKRSTENSAGYDFYAFEDIKISPMSSSFSTNPVCIKTGVKAYMQDDECLQLYPRSSWPANLGLVLANSVGIIDSDYYSNENNDGEIGFLVYNLSFRTIRIHAGDKLGQGVFTKYLKIDNDDAEGDRIGGFGSTGL